MSGQPVVGDNLQKVVQPKGTHLVNPSTPEGSEGGLSAAAKKGEEPKPVIPEPVILEPLKQKLAIEIYDCRPSAVEVLNTNYGSTTADQLKAAQEADAFLDFKVELLEYDPNTYIRWDVGSVRDMDPAVKTHSMELASTIKRTKKYQITDHVFDEKKHYALRIYKSEADGDKTFMEVRRLELDFEAKKETIKPKEPMEFKMKEMQYVLDNKRVSAAALRDKGPYMPTALVEQLFRKVTYEYRDDVFNGTEYDKEDGQGKVVHRRGMPFKSKHGNEAKKDTIVYGTTCASWENSWIGQENYYKNDDRENGQLLRVFTTCPNRKNVWNSVKNRVETIEGKLSELREDFKTTPRRYERYQFFDHTGKWKILHVELDNDDFTYKGALKAVRKSYTKRFGKEPPFELVLIEKAQLEDASAMANISAANGGQLDETGFIGQQMLIHDRNTDEQQQDDFKEPVIVQRVPTYFRRNHEEKREHGVTYFSLESTQDSIIQQRTRRNNLSQAKADKDSGLPDWMSVVNEDSDQKKETYLIKYQFSSWGRAYMVEEPDVEELKTMIDHYIKNPQAAKDHPEDDLKRIQFLIENYPKLQTYCRKVKRDSSQGHLENVWMSFWEEGFSTTYTSQALKTELKKYEKIFWTREYKELVQLCKDLEKHEKTETTKLYLSGKIKDLAPIPKFLGGLVFTDHSEGAPKGNAQFKVWYEFPKDLVKKTSPPAPKLDGLTQVVGAKDQLVLKDLHALQKLTGRADYEMPVVNIRILDNDGKITKYGGMMRYPAYKKLIENKEHLIPMGTKNHTLFWLNLGTDVQPGGVPVKPEGEDDNTNMLYIAAGVAVVITIFLIWRFTGRSRDDSSSSSPIEDHKSNGSAVPEFEELEATQVKPIGSGMVCVALLLLAAIVALAQFSRNRRQRKPKYAGMEIDLSTNFV